MAHDNDNFCTSFFMLYVTGMTVVPLASLLMLPLGCTAEVDLAGSAAEGGAITETGDGMDDDAIDPDEANDGQDDGSADNGGAEGADSDGGSVDSGSGDDGDGGGGVDLTDPIDLLFVIDDSASMILEQQRLLEDLEPFLTQLGTALPENTDWHIGMIGSDGLALIDHGLDNIDCFPNTDANYLSTVGALTPELIIELECVLDSIGIGGDANEHPAESLLGALDPFFNQAGAINDGFARPEAELIVVVVADEDDAFSLLEQGSLGDPVQWAEQLAGLREQGESAISMIGVLGQSLPNACPEAQLDLDLMLGGLDLDYVFNLGAYAEPGPRLQQLVESVPQNIVTDICDDDYGEAFSLAVDMIAEGHGG
ncbi:MAG: hypothetical protein KC431_19845 [Myxococcales bacterium]|nr:hypothetical protein [Myxococcales bacterium]